MSAATLEPVTQADIIELVALAFAAADLITLDDKRISKELRDLAVGHFAGDLRERLLPMYDTESDSDSAWEEHPIELELEARKSEIEAELIDWCLQSKANTARLTATNATLYGRPARLRLLASRLREAGTQHGITLPSERETWDVARERDQTEGDGA